MSSSELRPLPDPVRLPLNPKEAHTLCESIIANVDKALVGRREAVLRSLVAIAARGHLLLEDVPGVGKSSLAQALARSFGLPLSRIQFTSDLLPADVLGVTTWDSKSESFVFRKGPIFSHVVLADELNRTPPRTQSALLEAMAEGQVSLDGETRPLPRPFFVIATLNPQEQQGTYPLPESQLDRFLVRLSLGYPEAAEERELLLSRGLADPVASLGAVASVEDVLRLQAAAEKVRLEASVADYILAIASATRRDRRFSLGVSTRGALALAAAARAHALLAGRDFVLPEDVKAMVVPVLAHRVVVAGRDDGSEGAAEVIDDLLHAIPVPE